MVNHLAVIVLRRTITALPKIRQGGLEVYCFMLAVIRCALTNRFIARACQGDAFIFEHLWRREIDCYTICIVQAFLQVEYNQKFMQQGRVRAIRKNGGERGRNKKKSSRQLWTGDCHLLTFIKCFLAESNDNSVLFSAPGRISLRPDGLRTRWVRRRNSKIFAGSLCVL